MKKMRRCAVCEAYTLSEVHCDEKTASAHPPIFNPTDPYGKYRRKMKGL